MTRIRAKAGKKKLSIECTGHAGDSTICAAISMMTQALYGWIINDDDTNLYREELKDAHVLLTFDRNDKSYEVYKMCVIALTALAETYGEKYVTISGDYA